jgi:hypothetical protein
MKVSYYYFLDIIDCFVIENELLKACRVFIDVSVENKLKNRFWRFQNSNLNFSVT